MFRWITLCLFVVAVCLAGTSAMAQSQATSTGNYQLGGMLSWNSVDNENATDRTNTYTLAPRVMYFWMDNVALGAEVGFQGLSSGGDGFSSQRYFALGEFVLPGGNENFRFYGEAGGGFARMTTNDSVGGDFAFNGWGLTGGIGAYLFVNEHVAITPAVSYIYETFADDGTVSMGSNQTVYFRVGVSGFMLP